MTSTSRAKPFAFAPGVPEQVADHLQARIVRGELAPGERIAEARITEELGVSRGPVREALQQLAARHLVVLEPRRGARVSAFDLDDARGLFDVYGALVTRLAERVAERAASPADAPEGGASSDAIAALMDVHQGALARATKTGDLLEVLAVCDAFLDEGARVLGNDYLRDVLARLAPAFGRAHYVALASSADAAKRLARFVGALIDTVIAGQQARVAAIVERYAAAQLNEIEQLLGGET